jgi:hypothetical protein
VTRPARTRDVWDHQARIARQLAAWSIASIATGAATAAVARRSPAARAFGGQHAAWGAIDLGIAAFGELRRRGRLATIEDRTDPATLDAERTSLRRVLLVNAALDVGYVAVGTVGVVWAWRRRPRGPVPAGVGHSAAVVVQGTFLLGFDAWHARHLRGAPSGPAVEPD